MRWIEKNTSLEASRRRWIDKNNGLEVPGEGSWAGGDAVRTAGQGAGGDPQKATFSNDFVTIIVDCIIGVQWIVNGGAIYTLCGLKGLSGFVGPKKRETLISKQEVCGQKAQTRKRDSL